MQQDLFKGLCFSRPSYIGHHTACGYYGCDYIKMKPFTGTDFLLNSVQRRIFIVGPRKWKYAEV